MSLTKRTVYLSIAFLAVILAAYSYTWHCDFIDYDDNNHVYENERVRAGLSVANVIWAFTHFHASQWIPLTWVSFMVDISLFGLDPGPMHLVNVALHYINTLLLFAILWKITGAYWRSACVAALFATHPINVETVAWITERKSLLNTLLWFLAIACHVKYASTRCARWMWLTAICMVMGVMTKAMIVTLPFTLLLLDAWPLRRAPAVAWHQLFLEKVPLFLLSAVACAVQIHAGMVSGLLWSTEMAPISLRIFGAADNALKYIGSLIWPTKLSIRYAISHEIPYLAGTVSAVFFAALLLVGWKYRSRAPYILVGALWYLGTLVPVSGIVRAGDASFADRYTYVPQIGIFILIVWALGSFANTRWRAAAASFAVFLIAAFTALTERYVALWKNSVTLFDYAAQTHPGSVRAQELAASAHSKAGNEEAAVRYYRQILQLAPYKARIRNAFGVHLARTGRIDAAIQEFRRAASDDPSLVEARFNLGTHLVVQEGKSQEAIEVMRQVLVECPSHDILHYWIGKALEMEGRREEALHEYQKRSHADPADAAARKAIARLRASI